MADHVIKMSEVPKGQRYQQFKDYYRTPLIIAVLCAIMIFSFIKTIVFRPRPDSFLLIATSYDLPEDFTASIEELYAVSGPDFNENDERLISTNHILYNPLILKTDPEAGAAMQTKLMAVLSSPENIMQIVDEDLFRLLKEQELIGTYSDLGEKASMFSNSPDEEIKIPLSEIAFFKNEAFIGKTDGLYMTIRPRDGSQLNGKEKKIAVYENQIDAFITFCK